MIINGNSLEELKKFPDNYFHSVVTDPPYGLSFMGKKWDYDVPNVELWKEVFRVLKEGGYLLSFAGTRTQHRMAVNIEDAGFEIRDMIAWVYGSGFPKSHNIGKAVDKLQGNERIIGDLKFKGGNQLGVMNDDGWNPKDVYEESGNSEWEGWGTALKPALEPITMARKPFKGTVANNVLKNGVGGINIDGSRVEGEKPKCKNIPRKSWREMEGRKDIPESTPQIYDHTEGRFPANFIHDGSDEVTDLLEESSRFFYCAKASKQDREENNKHPTVKPTDLMRYLVRLVTPKNGIVLDCFMGSGSTGKACALEGFEFVGIDLDKDYCKIAKARIDKALEDKKQAESQTKLF
jgi:DNA modification methylase|tara:strand:+ start:1326 stop:2372 length:1047 start_codon:yes stop_codon:yes gene_type:complete